MGVTVASEPRPAAVDFVTLFGVHGARDTDGRPLGEGRAPRARQAVTTEFVRCPYTGSRHRHANPMNRTALRQMTTHWDEVIGGLDELRRRYARRASPAAMTLDHLWRLSIGVVALPAYLLHRGLCPLRDGEIPVAVAALYKTVLGIKAVIEGMIVDAVLADRPALGQPTVAEVHRWAEARSFLIGPEEVCAGPPGLIDEVIATLLGVADARHHGAFVGALIRDGEGWLDFGTESGHLLLALLAFATEAIALDLEDAADRRKAESDFTGYPEQQLSLTLGLRYLARPLARLAAPARRATWARLATLLAVENIRPDVEALVPPESARWRHPAATYADLAASVAVLLDVAGAGLNRALGRCEPAPLDRGVLVGYCGNRVSTLGEARVRP